MQFEALAKSFSRRELPNSEIELTGEIPAEETATRRGEALAHLAGELELPGFRKGHVPESLALQKLGELTILEEAVELFMRDFYPELLEAHQLDAIGRPDIRITKLAPGNPVALTIRTALYPTIDLPKRWKEIGRGVEVETVPDILDAEIDEALQSIRRARAKAEQKTPEEKSGLPGVGDPRTFSKDVFAEPEQLPALDDDFAKSLGNFTDLADLKAKLRENMKSEKEQKSKGARRGKIIEKLLEQVKLDVPTIFVDSELGKIMAQLKEDIGRFGLTFEQYLKQSNKTEAQVEDEFRAQARKRAQLQLTLNKIAEEEKLEADKEKVDEEMKHALEHFPDARPDLVRVHIETVLRNEKVLQLLESEQ